MAKSQPALLGTQGSRLVLARARPPWPWPWSPQWPKVNQPCWALKGLGPAPGLPNGPKSTSPVGHSGLSCPRARPPWPLWPKVNQPCWGALLGTQGPGGQPALLGTSKVWGLSWLEFYAVFAQGRRLVRGWGGEHRGSGPKTQGKLLVPRC